MAGHEDVLPTPMSTSRGRIPGGSVSLMAPVTGPVASGWGSLDRRQRGVLGCTLCANAVVFFDQTAVTVALPAIGRDLGANAAQLPG